MAVRQERRIEDGMIRPRFFWNEPDDPSGIAGYAVRVDGNPDTVPVVVNQGPGERSWDSRGLKAGEYHFHVRAVDNRGNAGPVTHVPFRVGAEMFRGFLALQNRPLSRVEETLRLLEDELALSNDYRKAEYAALLGYYRNAEREMDNHDIPMAVNWVSRAVLIDPGKLETALFLTLAEKRKADFWRRYDIAIVIAIYLTVILVLSVFYTAVNR